MDDDGHAQLKDMQTGEQLTAPDTDAVIRDVLRGPGL
jgi:hypothetical protein